MSSEIEGTSGNDLYRSSEELVIVFTIRCYMLVAPEASTRRPRPIVVRDMTYNLKKVGYVLQKGHVGMKCYTIRALLDALSTKK